MKILDRLFDELKTITDTEIETALATLDLPSEGEVEQLRIEDREVYALYAMCRMYREKQLVIAESLKQSACRGFVPLRDAYEDARRMAEVAKGIMWAEVEILIGGAPVGRSLSLRKGFTVVLVPPASPSDVLAAILDKIAESRAEPDEEEAPTGKPH